MTQITSYNYKLLLKYFGVQNMINNCNRESLSVRLFENTFILVTLMTKTSEQ